MHSLRDARGSEARVVPHSLQRDIPAAPGNDVKHGIGRRAR